MILSDKSILEALRSNRLIIDPFMEDHLQPSSIDLRLASVFHVFRNNTLTAIDPFVSQQTLTERVDVGSGPFILHPGEFALGATMELIGLARDLVARIEGKSSLGRLGLLIHATAGFIDPGFHGHITLELSNVANLPIKLHPGMKIGQVSFMEMTTPATTPYGAKELRSKYQGQREPTPSRYHENPRPEWRPE